MSVVYWIRHKDHTDMFSQGYIGVSNGFEKRLVDHKVRTQNAHLKHAIKKYGWENLVKQQIIVAEMSYCLEMEAKLRPSEKMGWNLVIGGGKPPVQIGNKSRTGKTAWNKGRSWSAEHREKISNSVKKLWDNEEYRKNMSEKHKGYSNFSGKKHSSETIEKMKNSHKANKGAVKCL